MRKCLLMLTAGMATITNAQTDNPLLDNISLEAGYGYNMIISPTEQINASNLNSFSSFHGAFTYHINDLWGVRGSYYFNKFEDKNNSDLGVTFHRLMLEGTYEILEALNNSPMYTTEKEFDITAHAGLGLGVGISNQSRYSQTDMIGSAQVGLKPTYFITPQFRVFVDASYIFNFSQDYSFDGGSATQVHEGKIIGNFTSFHFGVQYKLKR